MASYNRVVLMGNLTRDIELRYLSTGTAVCDIGLAVNERRKNSQTGEWIEETTFIDVTLWNRTAEIAGEYLAKGSSVLIEGRLRMDSWEQDGQKRTKLKVVADQLVMLGSQRGQNPNQGGGFGAQGNASQAGYGSANRQGGYGQQQGYGNQGGYGAQGNYNQGGYGAPGNFNQGGYQAAQAPQQPMNPSAATAPAPNYSNDFPDAPGSASAPDSGFEPPMGSGDIPF